MSFSLFSPPTRLLVAAGMNLCRIYRSVCKTARNHGLRPALYDAVLRAVDRCIYLQEPSLPPCRQRQYPHPRFTAGLSIPAIGRTGPEFTLDRYRGLRFHAISKTRALTEFLSRGFRGMVFYVESNNFNSIKSACRMGARDCGRIRVVRLMGRYVVRVQSGCRQYGLTLNPNPA